MRVSDLLRFGRRGRRHDSCVSVRERPWRNLGQAEE